MFWLLFSAFLATMFSMFYLYNPFVLSLFLIMSSMLLGSVLMFSGSKWLGISIILVFVGGMMITFIYISSLAANSKWVLPSFTPSIFVFLFFLLFPVLLWPPHSEKTSYFYLLSYSHVAIVTIVFLLLALLLVVKITECFKGALVEKF